MDTFKASLTDSDSPAQPSGFVYLGGGGSANDEANVWKEAFEPGQRIVIWPFAQPRHRWDGIQKWFTGALAARGDMPSTSISLVDTVPGGGLEAADIVVIPGGNTFELLEILRSHGLLDALRRFVEKGGKVYGGSAGAIIVGADIGLTDAEQGGTDANTIALQDTQGLKLLGDIAVYPHWEAQSTTSGPEAWAKRTGRRVLFIPEKSGVVVDLKERMGINKGPENVMMFSPDGDKRTLKAEESFTF